MKFWISMLMNPVQKMQLVYFFSTLNSHGKNNIIFIKPSSEKLVSHLITIAERIDDSFFSQKIWLGRCKS